MIQEANNEFNREEFRTDKTMMGRATMRQQERNADTTDQNNYGQTTMEQREKNAGDRIMVQREPPISRKWQTERNATTTTRSDTHR